MAKKIKEPEECKSILKPVRDALDILNGKWKLPIIIALSFGEKRYGEIAREVHGITDRMLSRELRDLEINGLVKRKVLDTHPVKITYELTPQSDSLDEVIEALRKWGMILRKNMVSKKK
ncbi:MAG: helix-turn-helix domain-containing protein [Flavitalea sp.]